VARCGLAGLERHGAPLAAAWRIAGGAISGADALRLLQFFAMHVVCRLLVGGVGSLVISGLVGPAYVLWTRRAPATVLDSFWPVALAWLQMTVALPLYAAMGLAAAPVAVVSAAVEAVAGAGPGGVKPSPAPPVRRGRVAWGAVRARVVIAVLWTLRGVLPVGALWAVARPWWALQTSAGRCFKWLWQLLPGRLLG
jgi:hypothetical protein